MIKETPHSPDIEENLISAVLLDNFILDECRIEPEHFWSEKNRIVWRGVQHLYLHNGAVEPASLMEHLRIQGTLEQAGGPAYILGLMDTSGTGAMWDVYERTLLEHDARREIIRASEKAARRAYELHDPNEILNDMEHFLTNAKVSKVGDLKYAIESAARYATGEALVKTGFPTLDNFRDELTKAEADVLINQQDELTQAYIQQFALAKSATIATTSVSKVKDRIDKGVRAGDSISEIAGSIRSIQLINSSRAETIARTEVHGAANYAQLETATKAEKEFDIKMVKEWVAVNDSRTRDPHANVDGQTVDKDSNFNVNGEMMARPLDPNASAENVINCRCSMIFRKKEYQID